MSNILPNNLLSQLVRSVPSVRAVNNRFRQLAREVEFDDLVNEPVTSGLFPITHLGLDIRSVDRLAIRAWWIDGLHQVLTGQLPEVEFYRLADQLRSSGLPYHYYDFIWAVIAVSHLGWFANGDPKLATKLLDRILQDTGPLNDDSQNSYPIDEAYNGRVADLPDPIYEWLTDREIEPNYTWAYENAWTILGDWPIDLADAVRSTPDVYDYIRRQGYDAESAIGSIELRELSRGGVWPLVGQYLNSGVAQASYEQPTNPNIERVNRYFREIIRPHWNPVEPAFFLTLHHLAPFLVHAGLDAQQQVVDLLPTMPPSLQRRLLNFISEHHWDSIPTRLGSMFTLEELEKRLTNGARWDLKRELPLEIGSGAALDLLLQHWTEADLQMLHQVFWDQVFIIHDNVALLDRFWRAVDQPPVPPDYTRYAHSPRCQRWLLLSETASGGISDTLLLQVGESFWDWLHHGTIISWDLMLLWRTISQMLTQDQRAMVIERLTDTLGDFEDRWGVGTINSLVHLAREMVDRS